MDDDRKKSPSKRSPGGRDPGGRSPKGGKPSFGKPAGGKPAWKKDGKPSSNRTERTPRPMDADGKPRVFRPRRDDAPASADAPKKVWRPRPEGDAAPARKEGRPFRKSAPGDKPFAARGSGDKPYRKPAEAGEKREYRPRRDDTAASGDAPRREWRPRPDSAAKPYRKPDGDRPFAKRAEGDRPERKPFDKKPRSAGFAGDRPRPEGDRPFRKREEAAGADGAPKREYRPRPAEGGDKPFRPRPQGDRPQGDRPFRDGPRPDRPFSARPPRSDRPDRSDRPKRDDDRPVRDLAAPEEGERIAKRLARAGISSRRDAEEMIAAGRVKVNGKVLASPAINVGQNDIIHVDNELIPAIERTRLFLFNKPAGLVTTNRDPEGRKTVFDVLPEELPRLLTIGRLDINTEGLLLLTNDGGLARVLELPATGWLRRYRARVHGRVDEKKLLELKDGIAVDGVFYGAIDATLDREQGSNAWLTLGLREGKNREVKNVLGALGLEVSRLIRISFGPFQLGELPEGAVHELNGRTLRDQLGERLIEESGANFDAPVINEFSNNPVARARPQRGDDVQRRPPRADAGEDVQRRPRTADAGEGGLVKGRSRRDRPDRREDALGRLQTTKPPMRGGKRKEEKPYEAPRPRSSNVWMAPGARPQGKKAEPEETPREGGRKPPREGFAGRKPPRKPTR